jgi:hypothetical protein
MTYRALFLTAVLTTPFVAADQLSLYLGVGCRSAGLGSYKPVPAGECIDVLQAQSYILQKDNGYTYNLYSSRDCSGLEGDVTLSGCSSVGEIRSIKKVPNKKRSQIRGTTSPLSSKNSPEDLFVRDNGDTYQCPNVPYFLMVTTSSSVTEELFSRDEQTMRNDFMSAFSTAYQNPSGQTSVSSSTPYDGENIEDPAIQLRMVSGVIQDFQEREMEEIMRDLFIFRDRQRFPANFGVDIYTGIPDGPHGVWAHLMFRGE